MISATTSNVDKVIHSGSVPLPERAPDWYHRLLRTALLDYKSHRQKKQTKETTWLEVAGDILAETGVDMGSEVLRQYVRGTRTRPDHIRVPEPKNLAAIVAFLTAPDIGFLEAAELALPNQVDIGTGGRLARYLAQDLDDGPVAVPDSLLGTYGGASRHLGKQVFVELTFERASEDSPVLLVHETIEYFGWLDPREFEGLTTAQRRKQRDGCCTSLGWAIATPEDNLLVFLKEAAFGRNRYWTLAAAVEMHSQTKVLTLYLQAGGYPPEVGQTEPSMILWALERDMKERVALMARPKLQRRSS